MPTVSVIIPAYNSGPYLDEAVQSVIAQTFTDWECIVVDDGSTEDLSRIGKMDRRVRLVRQENGGTSAARNRGILISTGGLIAFIDHDDLWLPGKLASQVDAMGKASEVGLAFTGFDFIDRDGSIFAHGWGKPIGGYLDFLAEPGGPLLSASMMRRECVARCGLFDPVYLGTPDYDLALKISRDYRLEFIPERLTLFRRHAGNTSRNYLMMAQEAMNILEKHAIAARRRGDPGALMAIARCRRLNRLTFSAQAYDTARQSIREGRIGRAMPHLARAFAWNPRYVVGAVAKYPLQRISRRKRPGERRGEIVW